MPTEAQSTYLKRQTPCRSVRPRRNQLMPRGVGTSTAACVQSWCSQPQADHTGTPKQPQAHEIWAPADPAAASSTALLRLASSLLHSKACTPPVANTLLQLAAACDVHLAPSCVTVRDDMEVTPCLPQALKPQAAGCQCCMRAGARQHQQQQRHGTTWCDPAC